MSALANGRRFPLNAQRTRVRNRASLADRLFGSPRIVWMVGCFRQLGSVRPSAI